MAPFLALVRRDVALAFSAGSGALLGVMFFLIVIVALPLGVGPDLNLLARLGPAFLWIGVLLSTLLALDRLFQVDHDDGALDLLTLSGLPLELLVLAKCLAHWLTAVVPLIVAAPLMGLFLNVSPTALGATILTVLVGSPALTMIGAIGAALTVTVRRGSLLLAILIVPLTLPVLIFGIGAVNGAVVDGLPFRTPLLLLLAASLASVAIAPFAAAAALRAARG